MSSASSYGRYPPPLPVAVGKLPENRYGEYVFGNYVIMNYVVAGFKQRYGFDDIQEL